MKRKILLLLMALLAISASVKADGLTATLQQGDVMTPFYGVNAFQEAYAAAENGAVITLSSGKFNDVTDIKKSISIIGAYAFDVNSSVTTFLSSLNVKADNVKIEGIYFTGNINLYKVKNTHIKRCWIESVLKSYETHTDTKIDQCVVKDDAAIDKGINYSINNSTITYFSVVNSSSNIAHISNCNICCWIMYNNSNYKQPVAIYKNNVLGADHRNNPNNTSISCSSPSEFYYNYLYRYNSYSSYSDYVNHYYFWSFGTGCLSEGNISSANSSPYKNTFTYPNRENTFGTGGGTYIGTTGGTGFSPYPSIPRVTSKQIDANTDSEGKIRIKINVQAQN